MLISVDFRNVVVELICFGELIKMLDVIMGLFIDLWGFGLDKKLIKCLSDEVLVVMVVKIGVDKFEFIDVGLMKIIDGLELLFFVIVKGYGIDKVVEVIESYGLINYMVEIGGEFCVLGIKFDNIMWKIVIEQFDVELGVCKVYKVIELGINGIVILGDY